MGLGRLATAARLIGRRQRTFGPWSGVRIAIAETRVRSTVRRVRVPGTNRTVLVRLGRGETDLNVLLDVFVDRCYEIELESPRWIIDAGANIGLATLWFALHHPTARIVAVEPDAGNLAVARENLSDLPSVELVAAALMDFDGVGVVVDPGDGPWGLRVQAEAEGWSEGRVVGRVDCVSMPTIIERHGIDRIDLLKLDIEGGEVEVLASSAEWIDRAETLAIELHDRFREGSTPAFRAATSGFVHEQQRDEIVIVSRREFVRGGMILR